jgi:epoxyqueuosine reductase QueG
MRLQGLKENFSILSRAKTLSYICEICVNPCPIQVFAKSRAKGARHRAKVLKKS